MKPVVYFLVLFLIPTVYAGAQHDPYGRVDVHNLGNINQQDYEISVLTTYRQNIPRVDTAVNIINQSNIDMKNIQDIRLSVSTVFNRYDADTDGRLTREEFGKIGAMVNTMDFDAIDTNKDGVISHDELTQGLLLKAQKSGGNKVESEKSARQKHDEAHPTLRVLYDETEGYYVR